MKAMQVIVCLMLLAAGFTHGRHLTETALEALQHPNTNPVDVTPANVEGGSLPSSVDPASVGSSEPDKTFTAQQNGGLVPACTEESPCELAVSAGDDVHPLSTSPPSVDANVAGTGAMDDVSVGTDGISAGPSGRKLLQDASLPTNSQLELSGGAGETDVPGQTVTDQEFGEGSLTNLSDDHIRDHGENLGSSGIVDSSNVVGVDPSGFDALDNAPVVTAGGN